jgi:hypothetical protein
MANLVLGPMLRFAGTEDATVWVETDAACTVEVGVQGAGGSRAATFCVHGHHYALVHVEGLEPDSAAPYEVRLDGERVWPLAGSEFPPSVIRTHSGGDGALTRIVFGSCRVCAPHHPPFSLRKDEDERGREVDSLRAIAQRMAAADDPGDWPHALLLVGDQVYADEVSPGVEDFIRSRRDPDVPPGLTIADFEEYTQLYRESWGEPTIRWLLSTVPSAMVFDDHDVIDDWNTSEAWIRMIRAKGWWDRRIVGGFMSYLLYQHWGNLSPTALARDELFQRVSNASGDRDATEALRDYAYRADREVEGTRWSFCRDIGPARVVMMDSRAGRVLEPGVRSMIDPAEERWIAEQTKAGDYRHLLLGTSLPLFLTRALHDLEAWNERVCDGAWGPVGSWVGEKVRQAADLEHWAAFNDSFEAMCDIIRAAGTGDSPPASIVALSGDVHHAYLAEVGFRPGTGMRCPVYQAVCSPFRNPLGANERRIMRTAASTGGERVTQLLARTAGARRPSVDWRYVHPEPWFDNQVATLELRADSGRFILERTTPSGEPHDGGRLKLERVFEHALTREP